MKMLVSLSSIFLAHIFNLKLIFKKGRESKERVFIYVFLISCFGLIQNNRCELVRNVKINY